MTAVRLADLCNAIDYGYTASARETPEGPHLLRITDIVAGPPQWEQVPFCHANQETTSRYKLDHRDIVIARTGATTGVSAFIAHPPLAVFASYLVRLKINEALADARFVSYYLKGPEFWNYIRGVLGDKSAQPNASAKTITQAPATVPPIHVQRAIAGVLGALDEKLQHNLRTARRLDELAWTIFKTWFVDFEPVNAKAAGMTSFPSMPQTTFEALHTRFVDSDVGPIPEGWKAMPLPNIATFLNGLALQKYPPRGDGTDLPVIKIAQLRSDSTEGAHLANSDVPAQYVIDNRDLLFSWSGTLDARFWFGGKGALNQHLFKVTSSHFPAWFCLLWIRHHLPWFRSVAASKATTMGHIQRGHLQEAKAVVPAGDVLRAADAMIGSLYALHAQLMLESRKLTAMRDLLLPKLLSGEARVKGVGDSEF